MVASAAEPFGPIAACVPFEDLHETSARASCLHFGWIKDSGIGSEGGSETFDGYLVTKFVTQMD